MNSIIKAAIALIGAYTLVRNNIRVFPDQTTWITHPDIFYKFFIPVLMLFSAVFSLIYREKINLFYLSFIAMLIDGINRLSVFINIYFMSIAYDKPGSMRPSMEALSNVNLLSSLIMLSIETLIVCYLFFYIRKARKTKSA